MNTKTWRTSNFTTQTIPDGRKAFGEAVRGWRRHLGISQEKLAERADLHRTYIADIERGARNPSLKSIENLARALEISTTSLFTYGSSPKSDRDSKNGSPCQPGKGASQTIPKKTMFGA